MTEPRRVTFVEFHGPAEPRSGDPPEAATAWLECDPIADRLFAAARHRPEGTMILVRQDGEETFAVVPIEEWRRLVGIADR